MMRKRISRIKGRSSKRKHYKTGIHHSTKCPTIIKYRSGWELSVCQFLDASEKVLKYEYESIQIPYISNAKTGKVRIYYPDFLIYFSSGRKVIVEVKRVDKLSNPKVMKKTAAGKNFAKKNGMEYELWTNEIITKIRLINEQRSK